MLQSTFGPQRSHVSQSAGSFAVTSYTDNVFEEQKLETPF